MAKSRPANEGDVRNIFAQAALKLTGGSAAGREAFRNLPAATQEEIHARAADERERQANGPTLT
jgi:hypothetical protein